MGFSFNKLVSGIKNVGHAIGDVVTGAANKVVGAVKTVEHKGEQAVETVYSDVKSLISHIPGAISGVTTDVITAGGNALGHVGGSLTLPLTIGAAGVIAVILFKQQQ